MHSKNPRAGFTLVEVLAALVVTAAFVAVVLPFAGRLATRWWVGEERVQVADGWMQAIARLGDELSQAVPLSVQQSGSAHADFKAGTDFVQFVKPALGTASDLRLETVRYEIKPSATGVALIRRAGLYKPDSPPDAPWLSTPIMDGPYRFRFRAYGDDRMPLTSWVNREDMPIGVELTILDKSGRSVLPSIILLPIVAKNPNPSN